MFMVPGDVGRWLACAVFTVAAVTDYFDGYVARTWNQLSELGRCLDPIADKLLVAAVLLLLAFFNSPGILFLLPALVILCREVLVSGLREYLAQVKVRLPVSRLAKWKTASSSSRSFKRNTRSTTWTAHPTSPKTAFKKPSTPYRSCLTRFARPP